MVYLYECVNDKCLVKEVNITKPMTDSSKIEFCEKCKKELKRVYSVGGIVTGDGVK